MHSPMNWAPRKKTERQLTFPPLRPRPPASGQDAASKYIKCERGDSEEGRGQTRCTLSIGRPRQIDTRPRPHDRAGG